MTSEDVKGAIAMTPVSSRESTASSSSSTKAPTVKKTRSKNTSSSTAYAVSSKELAGMKKARLVSLIATFIFVYLLIGSLLYSLAMMKFRGPRSRMELMEQEALEQQERMEREMRELNEAMGVGGMPPELIESMMMGGGFGPQGGTVRVRMVVRAPTSFRGGRGGSIEDMFDHDPFMQMLMGGAVRHLEENDSHHALPAPSSNEDNSQQQEAPSDDDTAQMIQHLMMGGALPVAPVQTLTMSDGEGHQIRINIRSPDEALHGFFPPPLALGLLNESGVLDSILNDILSEIENDKNPENKSGDDKKSDEDKKDANEDTKSDASTDAGESSNGESSSDESSDSEKDKDQASATKVETPPKKRRALVIASAEEASDLEALKDAMSRKFQSQGFNDVDVQNFVIPSDFIENNSFNPEGYHSIHDLGLLPKIMHATEMNGNAQTEEQDVDEEQSENAIMRNSAVHQTLEQFCNKLSSLLTCDMSAPESENADQEHCNFTSVNKVKPQFLEKAIGGVNACRDVFGSLEKEVSQKKDHFVQTWRTRRDKGEF